MVACGQMATHFKHWIQVFSSHTGISSAMLRFSHCAVPVGKVPSMGILETGRSSPRPSMIGPVTSRTKRGESLATGGGMVMVPFLTLILSHRGVPGDLAVKMAIATSMATILFYCH